MGDFNYRLFYQNQTGQLLKKDFVVHHIDFDRNNNDIMNLVMLPKTLHQKYHNLLQKIDSQWKCGKIILYTIISVGSPNVYMKVEDLIELYQILEECNYWLELRNVYLERRKQNGSF